MIEKEANEKNKLAEDIRIMKQRKYQHQDKIRVIEKKNKELLEREEDLKQEIEELSETKRDQKRVCNQQRGLKE